MPIRPDRLRNRQPWPEHLAALVARYGSLPEVARVAELPASTLYSIRDGSEPKHSTGEQILALVAALQGEPAGMVEEAAPVEPEIPTPTPPAEIAPTAPKHRYRATVDWQPLKPVQAFRSIR